MNARILMKNLVFFGHHGDLPAERSIGQRFIIDLALSLDIAEVARTDELQSTADYVAVYELCRTVIEGQPVNMLETLAARLTERILAENPRLASVEIVVKKPAVPLRGAVDYVAVELIRNRENSLSRPR
jgi:dihydroneopterin aldolase